MWKWKRGREVGEEKGRRVKKKKGGKKRRNLKRYYDGKNKLKIKNIKIYQGIKILIKCKSSIIMRTIRKKMETLMLSGKKTR